MDFKQVKKWKIPEGDVLSVTDSKNNILWEAPLQWDLEDGSTLTVTTLVDFEVNVINPNGEDFFIMYPTWICWVDISTGTGEVNKSETTGYRELDIGGVVGKCTITFNPIRTNITTNNTTNKEFILMGPDKDIVSSVTVTK